jgi:hypothetical protein
LLQDRTDDEAVKLRRLETSRGSSPRNVSVGAHETFGGLAPLHVRSERSPLHDVRQHAHANGARTRRIACANLFSRTSVQSKPAFAKASAGNLRGSRGWLANRSCGAAKVGGARRNRTDDLLLAKQALSQLSYGPALRHQRSGNWWAWEDLNFRPHAYQARALTN